MVPPAVCQSVPLFDNWSSGMDGHLVESKPAEWIEVLKRKELPHLGDIKRLCHKVKEVLASENNVLDVHPPMTVVVYTCSFWWW